MLNYFFPKRVVVTSKVACNFSISITSLFHSSDIAVGMTMSQTRMYDEALPPAFSLLPSFFKKLL